MTTHALERTTQGNIPRSTFVDGGYYCKTPENLPLVGPYACDAVKSGYHVCGATSGYGVMVAQVWLLPLSLVQLLEVGGKFSSWQG